MNHILVRISSKFIFIAIGIILLGSLTQLFSGIHIDFSAYTASVAEVIKGLLHPAEITYIVKGREYNIFPDLVDNWFYTMRLLFLSLLIALTACTTLTYLTMLLPQKVINVIKFILFSLKSLPDLLVAGILQMGVIWFYQQTEILIFQVANFGDNHSYALPLTALAILPTVLLYRIMILDVETELQQPYVELARSKGMKKRRILFVHIFRNVLISTFLHSKYLMWFLLSNLLVIEYIFSINGMMRFLLFMGSPAILTVGSLMVFVPVFLFFSIFQMMLEKYSAQKVEL